MTPKVEFTPTQRAILILLNSEDRNGIKYSPIPGRIHLIKELFAICQNDLGKKILPELKFEPDNFGPYDETIFAALDSLRDSGYVSFDNTSNSVKIQLTNKGKEVSDNLWVRLRDDIKILFSYTKRNLNHLSSERVLDKIYSAYPEMAVNSMSKVAEKYRPKNSSI